MKNWDMICSYMNDEIREELHTEMAPCSDEKFLAEYVKRDPEIIEILENEFDIDIDDIQRSEEIWTAVKETGTLMERFDSYEEAEEAIREYEREDRTEGNFQEDFYDIVDGNHCSIEK